MESDNLESDVVLITVSGEDRPGLIEMVTSTLAEYQVRILDFGGAIIHDEVSIGLYVALPDDLADSPVVKELLFRAHNVGVHLRFEEVSGEEYDDWVRGRDSVTYIVTLIGLGIDASHLAVVSGVLRSLGMNIRTVRRLTGRVPLGDDTPAVASIELVVAGSSAVEDRLREGIFDAARTHHFDFSVQRDSVFRRHRRLIAFDMDSTLIQAEVIDELARRHGVGDAVTQVTERAMSGGMDFSDSLQQRMALLRGLPETALDEVAAEVELTAGADRLIRVAQQLGLKTAVISGGFAYVGRKLQERLGIDYVFANEVEVEAGLLTGRVEGTIIDAEGKASILQELCVREGISPLQSIAVGDGANDLPMLRAAGLGVAFHAKLAVRESASHSISTFGLDSVLYLLGFSDRDLGQLAELPEADDQESVEKS